MKTQDLPAQTLRRILHLEQSKGYSDGAVIGGMDRFLRRWAGSIQEAITDPHHLTRFRKLFLSSSYGTWDTRQRQEWLEQALAFLEGVEGGRERKASPATPPAPRRRPSPLSTPAPSASLDSPVTVLRGVSQGLAGKLARLGVNTIRDLVLFFPRRHLDYSQLKPIAQLQAGEEQTIVANVWEARATQLGSRRGTEAVLGDETGNIRAVWFNQPYLARSLQPNAQVALSGRVGVFKGWKVLESPEWEILEDRELIHTGRLVPLYPLTQGLYPRQMRRLVKETVEQWADRLPDFLPREVKANCNLLELAPAIRQAHYPDSIQSGDEARRRLAFDELFLLQLGVLSRKKDWQEGPPAHPLKAPAQLEKFLASLPFTLTAAQEQALGEILADLAQPRPMSRLLQGDVGSGKTVVATAALLAAVASGHQAALMAPTEILAEQHFATICQLLARSGGEEGEGWLHRLPSPLERPIQVALLTGGLRHREKQEILRLLEAGEIDIVIGTHALIQREVELPRLALAVVDEQHRFGVRQRWQLRQKGFNPHVLVMTATPIPRTLALTIYGDLDISLIDQLPPGRQTVRTRWLAPEQREQAYGFIKRQVAQGQQAFIVCPLIEESEAIEARAAAAEYERLSQTVFPDLRLGLLHGRLPATEKETVMRQFRQGELHILVSTPVVEVGIDVPNATVMLVEGADRFGLSQLHQFRGRVGRGEKPSYCLLLAQAPSPEARERLAIIEKVHDGFRLAEEDLRLRGPGEFFGTRQSGLPDLRLARLSDLPLLETAREQAKHIFEIDPRLEKSEHHNLALEMSRVWKDGGELS